MWTDRFFTLYCTFYNIFIQWTNRYGWEKLNQGKNRLLAEHGENQTFGFIFPTKDINIFFQELQMRKCKTKVIYEQSTRRRFYVNKWRKRRLTHNLQYNGWMLEMIFPSSHSKHGFGPIKIYYSIGYFTGFPFQI